MDISIKYERDQTEYSKRIIVDSLKPVFGSIGVTYIWKTNTTLYVIGSPVTVSEVKQVKLK